MPLFNSDYPLKVYKQVKRCANSRFAACISQSHRTPLSWVKGIQ